MKYRTLIVPEHPLLRKVDLCVSAAAFSGNALAPGSIGTSFGHNLASRTAAAASNPLPTQLASTTLTLSASDGVDWLAQLFYAGPNQINFLIPEGAATGPATITIRSDTQTGVSGTLTLRAVAPGLFTANSSGQGAPAGDVVVAALDNTQPRQRLSFCGITPGSCIPSPIDLGPVGT